MRNLLPILLLAILTWACNRPAGVAASPPAPATPPPPTKSYAPTDADRALLWQISGNGLASSSYLFGTIHIIPEDDYFLPDGLMKAVNDADRMIFEIDMKNMQDPSVMMGLFSKINMNDGLGLKDLLAQPQYDSVATYFTDQGLPFMLFERMKPMFLSTMVGQDLDMNALQNGGGMTMSGMKSYEMELTEIAQSTDKDITGLETMEFQLSMFDSIPYEAQANMLMDAVRQDLASEDGDLPNEMEAMVKMYTDQRIAAMADMMTDYGGTESRFQELLLTRRNRAWIPKMETMMKGATTPLLFAVGAGHLGGEDGVIALLRRAGYTVEQYAG